MGTTTAAGLMTFAEFELLPDEETKLELLEGELIGMPPAKKKHVRASKHMFQILDPAVEALRSRLPESGIGEVYLEMGYRMGTKPGTWLIPDVSVTHADQAGDDNYYDGAPSIAIEVASDKQNAAYLEAKAEIYLKHGAREVWMLYPKTRHVWIRRAGSSTSELLTDAIRSELLPGIEIPLDKIFD